MRERATSFGVSDRAGHRDRDFIFREWQAIHCATSGWHQTLVGGPPPALPQRKLSPGIHAGRIRLPEGSKYSYLSLIPGGSIRTTV